MTAVVLPINSHGSQTHLLCLTWWYTTISALGKWRQEATLGYRENPKPTWAISLTTTQISKLHSDPDSFCETEGMSQMLSLRGWAAPASALLRPLAKELWGCGYSLCRHPQASSLLSCQHDFAQYTPAWRTWQTRLPCHLALWPDPHCL